MAAAARTRAGRPAGELSGPALTDCQPAEAAGTDGARPRAGQPTGSEPLRLVHLRAAGERVSTSREAQPWVGRNSR